MRTGPLTLVFFLTCAAALGQGRFETTSVPGLADLPLVEVPSKDGQTNLLAVHITGDGGYGTTDRGLSEKLAANGIPVVVLNSLHYFWKKRTPEGGAGDLERILEHYRQAWHREKYVIIGYSMGADVVPFMLTRLPKMTLERVALLALLGPGPHASFQFHLTQWFGHPPSDSSLAVQPELEKLKGVSMLCFAGDEDKEAICGRLDPGLAKPVALEGGHRIGSNFEPVADAILRELGMMK